MVMAEVAWRVPSAAPGIDEGDIEAVGAVLRSGVLAGGPVAASLEREFAAYCGARNAVALSSGTAALVLAGQALGLGRGDTVLVAGFTFAASANAFLSLGCDVVPVDVDAGTMNIDEIAFSAALVDHPQAEAVVVVDLFGSTAGTGAVIDAARRAGLAVIEDAAQAHGAAVEGGGGLVGSRADATTFSLYATKNMAAGEGGLLTTGRDNVAASVRRLRNHGSVEQYHHEVVGLNHRLPEMAAALARRQLARLDQANARRRSNARALAEWCSQAWGSDVVIPPQAWTGDPHHVFHQFTVRFPTSGCRDAVAAQLRQAGVDVRRFYPYTVAELPGVTVRRAPTAAALRDTVLSLPVHPGLTASQLAYLGETVVSTRLPVAAR